MAQQHRYWKLKNFAVTGSYLEVGEIMLYTSSDTNANSSATITSVSVADVSKWWDGLITVGYGAAEQSIYLSTLEVKWDFGASGPYPDIKNVNIAFYDNTERYPTQFDAMYSDDDVLWYTAMPVRNIDSSGKTNYTTVTAYLVDQSFDTTTYRPPHVAPPKFPIADLQCNTLYALNL